MRKWGRKRNGRCEGQKGSREEERIREEAMMEKEERG